MEGLTSGVHDSAMAADSDALAMALSAHARQGDLGENLRALNENGWTALHCAAIAGDAQPVNMLITAGSSINAKSSPAEDSPLHFAAAWDHRAIVDTLLGRGAFLESRNATNATPLHKACEYTSDGAATALLERGVDTKAVDDHGRTPLHVAAKHNAASIVIELLAAGADSDALDALGRRPIDLATGPTKVLLTPGSDDHATHVWLEQKGLLPHSHLFRAYGLTVDDLIDGVEEPRLKEAGMPVGVRLKVLKLMKAQDEADRDRDAIGATAHSAAVVRPFGDVDWQMTEGGEWYRTNAEPELLSGGGGAGAAPLQVIDPWDYDDTEWTQKYGAAQRSPSARAASPARSAGSGKASPSVEELLRHESKETGGSPQPQPEPEPEPEQSALSPHLDKSAEGGDVWDAESDDEAAQDAAEEDEEDTGVRPWFKRAVMTD